MAGAIWGMVCSLVAEDWCNTLEKRVKALWYLNVQRGMNKSMQYIKAEGVTESGKNWFQLKSGGWWKGVPHEDGRKGPLLILRYKKLDWVFETRRELPHLLIKEKNR